MKLKGRREPEVGMDMTPMIDCVFQLLIFFMCAATLSRVDFTPEVTLPVAPKALVPNDLRGRGTINVLPEGFMTDRGEPVTEERPFLLSGRLVDDRGLAEVLRENHGKDPDLRVYLRVDRNVDFAVVRRAIKACAEAGVYDIIFASFQSRGSRE